MPKLIYNQDRFEASLRGMGKETDILLKRLRNDTHRYSMEDKLYLWNKLEEIRNKQKELTKNLGYKPKVSDTEKEKWIY